MTDFQACEAKLNVTWSGQNGELPDPINFDAPDSDIKKWATEAIQSGSIPGINKDQNVDLTDFVVDRFSASESRPFAICMIRPKTPFGN